MFDPDWEVSFHTAGQGLFSSGLIHLEDKHCFEWIYDCGSTSGKDELDGAIARFQTTRFDAGRHRKDLDLVVLSHFDRDHINGIVDLLQITGIDRLLLPLVPLAARLALASAEDVTAQSGYFSFLLDPATYLREYPGAQTIREIVWIAPSRGEASSVPIANVTIEPSNEQFGRLVPAGRPVDLGQVELAQGGRIVVENPQGMNWEFVPYLPKINTDETFIAEASELAEALQHGKTKSARKKALASLKALYERKLPTKKLRNFVSIFLYAGPIDCSDANIGVCESAGEIDPPLETYVWRASHTSILYTGDGYLNTDGRLQALSTYLGRPRMAQVSIFQVMHHGSRQNWHGGLAKKLAPQFSVFSSDPHAKEHHPHGEVLQDFLAHRPVSIDKLRSATFFFQCGFN